MYEDSWYSFVSDQPMSRKPVIAKPLLSRPRAESLVPHPNRKQGASKADVILEQLGTIPDPILHPVDAPPKPRRATSYSDFYHVVKAQLASDAELRKKQKTKASSKGSRSLDALLLCDQAAATLDTAHMPLSDSAVEEKLLEASQREYLLYQDQLTTTQRHLDGLIQDADATLELLKSLSISFQSVQTQTTSFRSQCEGLLAEQHRLEKLADDVGTDLHYYAYLDTASRRLNAPGASQIVDDGAFGEMVKNIDACIDFMYSHESYRERDAYLARYNALLTKALYLLDHGLTARLGKVSQEIARQLAATKSESARLALAYGRFGEIMVDSFSLLPNIRQVIRCAYDEYGRYIEAVHLGGIYANSAANMFHTYFTIRDRDLKTMTQHDIEAFFRQTRELSLETACRNFIKQSFEKVYNEESLFVKIFSVEPTWSKAPDSAFQAIKGVSTSMAHPGNLAPVAASVQSALQTAKLQSIFNVVGWLSSEYSISEGYDEDFSWATRKHREYAARLLMDHLWTLADNAFAVEVAKSISKVPVQDDALKSGATISGAYPLVKQAIKLLAMYDQAMPKERSTKNRSTVFNIVRETIQVLQRAETRISSIKSGLDPDLFVIQNLLILKNELLSLEIGDLKRPAQPIQHFGRIWDTLSPQNWLGFFSSILGGSLWTRGAPSVTARTLTAEDMSEQLDELLRQSIYAFTKRWGMLINEAQSHKAGITPIGKVEAELERLLKAAFDTQPEVMSKLKEAIRLNAEAQNKAKGEKLGTKQY